MSALTEQIDRTAEECCRKMNVAQAEDFFAFQRERSEAEEGYKAKYKAIGVYYKGAKKGQVREVFEVDGQKFNKLWSLLRNYATKSTAVSHHFNNSMDIEDDIAEIKFLVFRALRFFGPRPSSLPFSKFFPLAVNNILTNSSRQRLETFKTMANYNTVSMFEELGGDDDGESLTLIDKLPVNDHKKVTFDTEIPEELKEAINLLINGHKITSAARELGMKRHVLQEKVMAFVEA